MKKVLTATLAVTLGLSVAGTAHATGYECKPSPQSEWKSEQQVREYLTNAGYDVRKIKVKNNCYEAYATADGKRFEVFVQPDTGVIAEIWED